MVGCVARFLYGVEEVANSFSQPLLVGSADINQPGFVFFGKPLNIYGGFIHIISINPINTMLIRYFSQVFFCKLNQGVCCINCLKNPILLLADVFFKPLSGAG